MWFHIVEPNQTVTTNWFCNVEPNQNLDTDWFHNVEPKQTRSTLWNQTRLWKQIGSAMWNKTTMYIQIGSTMWHWNRLVLHSGTKQGCGNILVPQCGTIITTQKVSPYYRELMVYTGCSQKGGMQQVPPNPSFFGLFLMFWTFFDHSMWAIFHSSTFGAYDWKKNLNSLILKKG